MNIYEYLNRDKGYTISGNGECTVYADDVKIEVNDRDLIKSVEFTDDVTVIGEGAFRYCYNLTVVKIGKNVIKIGESAFDYCGIVKITIPKTVKEIGSYVFSRCYDLCSVIFECSVDIFNDGLFFDCYNLKNINIPKSVISLGEYVFYRCNSIEKILCESVEIYDYLKTIYGDKVSNR